MTTHPCPLLYCCNGQEAEGHGNVPTPSETPAQPTPSPAVSAELTLHGLLLNNGFRYVDYDEATFTDSLSSLEARLMQFVADQTKQARIDEVSWCLTMAGGSNMAIKERLANYRRH